VSNNVLTACNKKPLMARAAGFIILDIDNFIS